MAAITADFELGTQGATVATTDTGSATAWNTVAFVANGTCIYDNANSAGAEGTMSCKVATGATAGAVWVQWDTAFGTQTDHYGRIYLYLTANPVTTSNRFVRTTNPSNAALLAISTTGKIQIIDSAQVVQATSTNSIGLNQWARIEFHIIHSATVGQVEVKLFNSPDSTVATETLTSAASLNLGANATAILFGLGNNGTANQGPYWIDNILAAATSYPGPAGAAVALPLMRTLRGAGV